MRTAGVNIGAGRSGVIGGPQARLGLAVLLAALALAWMIPEPASANSGIFLPYAKYLTGSVPTAVAIGDVNGDGRDDVAVTTSSSNSTSDRHLQIFLQNGDGGLDAPVEYLAGESIGSVAIGDVNGDGRLDVVVANQGGIGVLLQDAAGALEPMVQYPALGVGSAAVGDLDGDGRQDVVAIGSGLDTLMVFGQTEAGTLGEPLLYALAQTGFWPIVLGDLNGDGRLDVVLRSRTNSLDVAILLQTDAGTLAPAQYLSLEDEGQVYGAAVGDVTGDGLADLVISDGFNARLEVIPQGGEPGLGAAVNYPQFYLSGPVAIADVNRDGKKDAILLGSGRLAVLLQGADGRLGPAEHYPAPADNRAIAVGDINGDGWPDVVSLGCGGLCAFLNAAGETPTYPLSLIREGPGDGRIIGRGLGLDCGSYCARPIAAGMSITLQAEPASGSVFAGWSGACGGAASACSLTMAEAKTVGARFEPAATLSVVLQGAGTGDVHGSDSGGISCDSQGWSSNVCSKDYPIGTALQLEARADSYSGSVFAGWGGACVGTQHACLVQLDYSHLVIAAFEPGTSYDPPTLAVEKEGTGSGRVRSLSGGIECGSFCRKNYLQGTALTLVAEPDAGSVFAGWGGACQQAEGVRCSVTMNGDQRAIARFTRDESDPYYDGEWHLGSGGANVTAVWPTTKGTGVVIGIVDDGIQHTHPDLRANYRADLSWDFNGNDPSPAPGSLGDCSTIGNCHGTAVAGVAAARDGNGVGVRGVAPEASLAGIRLIGGPASDAQVAEALGYKPDEIHISNNSWGLEGELAPLEPLTEAALEHAVTQGRGGKGRIFVRAAGNGAATGEDCNSDGFANSRYAIAVGAITSEGAKAEYSESCAALFVGAPSSGGIRGISTTDLVGSAGYSTTDYTTTFGGTSAAAPIVSGVVALMLARNPDLSWRDVRHILARTAIRTDLPEEARAGEPRHSPEFGFGRVDAEAAVALASGWTEVGPEARIEPPERPLERELPAAVGGGLPQRDSLTIGDDWAGFRVEHVDIVLDAVQPSRGDLEVALVSPSGERSVLAAYRKQGSGADYPMWRFGSVHHWGESPVGEWTLEVTNHGAVPGRWKSWSLRIYGTEFRPATLIGPAPDGPLPGSSAIFTWAPSDPPALYWLEVGTSVGGSELYSGPLGSQTSAVVTGLPIDGRMVHARLYSYVDHALIHRDYTFTGGSAALMPLTVAVTGPGRIGSDPAGIDCGSDCSELLPPGSVLTLTAAPGAGGALTAWGGACSGSGLCVVTLDRARHVTAEFETVKHALSVAKEGPGGGSVVSSFQGGIDCGSDCGEEYYHGTVVTLAATAQTWSSFAGWGGACAGTGVCTVTMDAAKQVTATFARPQYNLAVRLAGTGVGQVSSTPFGISCGGDCGEPYANGSCVRLYAAPAAGSTFTGWSGDVAGTCAFVAPIPLPTTMSVEAVVIPPSEPTTPPCGTEQTCDVSVTAARSLTATFAVQRFALSVTRSGSGGGTVVSAAPGIACGLDCGETYNYGTAVTLTARSDATSSFDGWSGGGCAGTDPCMLTVDGAKAVTATFTRIMRPLAVDIQGGGTVSSTQFGVWCDRTCEQSLVVGSRVTLTATPSPGLAFTGWTGACTNATGTCSVLLSEPRSVGARFAAPVVVTRTGSGSGVVTASPAGITCGADCREYYPYGTSVTLTAEAAVGSTLTKWSGCDGAEGATCTVAAVALKSVGVTFTKNSYPLTVTRSGSGTVVASTGGIACGAVCAANVSHGTRVTLTATPLPGSRFLGWEGACTQASGPCVVTMDEAKAVGASFQLLPPAIATLTPAAGAVGMPVTLGGSYFGTSLGTLTFPGGVAASVVSWAATGVRATVPAGAQSGELTLTTGDGRTATKAYTAREPVLSGIAPASAAVGSGVVLGGNYLGAVPGTVAFTGAAGPVAGVVRTGGWSNTAVRLAVPAGAVSGPVTLTTADGRVAAVSLKVLPPAITGIAPGQGSVGTPVSIVGMNFGSAAGTVTFAGRSEPVGATVTSWAAGVVRASVPVGAVTGELTLTTADGKRAGRLFTVPDPVLASLTPATAAVGVPFRISGSNLGLLRGTVTFAGGSAATITQWADTGVAGLVPAGAESGPVTLATADGRTASASFTAPAPLLRSVTPASGAVGAAVTLGGTHLGAVAGTVTFTGAGDPIPAQVSRWLTTGVWVAVPAGALSGPVTLMTADGRRTEKTFTVLLPSIGSLAPAAGAPGASVTIAGANFGTALGSVRFAGSAGPVAATVGLWAAGSVRVTVPVGAITGPLTLTTADGKSATKPFTVPDPLLKSVSPATGSPGVAVVISGTGFGLTPGAVTFSGSGGPAEASLAPGARWGDTAIRVLVPAAAVTGEVRLTRADGVSVAKPFTVADPSISSVSPASGLGGASVVIVGTNFGVSPGSVTFSSGSSATIVAWTVGRVTVKVPAGLTAGQTSVTLTTAGGKSASKPFTVLQASSGGGSGSGGGAIIITPPQPPPPSGGGVVNPAPGAIPVGS